MDFLLNKYNDVKNHLKRELPEEIEIKEEDKEEDIEDKSVQDLIKEGEIETKSPESMD